MVDIGKIHKILSKTNVFLAGKRYGDLQDAKKSAWIQKVDLRKYEFGDNAKHINRKASLKTQELVVNEFQKDSNLVLDIFLDLNQNRLGWYDISHLDGFFEFLKQQSMLTNKHTIQIVLYLRDSDHHKVQSFKLWSKTFVENLLSVRQNMLVQIQKTKSDYISNLDNFVQDINKLSNKSVIVIFSDFMDISNHLNFQNYLAKNQWKTIFTYQLDVYNTWENYDAFFWQKLR